MISNMYWDKQTKPKQKLRFKALKFIPTPVRTKARCMQARRLLYYARRRFRARRCTVADSRRATTATKSSTSPEATASSPPLPSSGRSQSASSCSTHSAPLTHSGSKIRISFRNNHHRFWCRPSKFYPQRLVNWFFKCTNCEPVLCKMLGFSDLLLIK